jgi:hypothetical protein
LTTHPLFDDIYKDASPVMQHHFLDGVEYPAFQDKVNASKRKRNKERFIKLGLMSAVTALKSSFENSAECNKRAPRLASAKFTP